MQYVKTASLVLDFDLYPRPQVDSQHVSEMCEAEAAGIEFPPVVADKKSKRVTDGFHRVRKQLRVHGEDSEIPVVFKNYKSEADMVLDAMRLNAHHGRKLNSYDRAHCLLLAEKYKINDDVVAAALAITGDKMNEIRVSKTAVIQDGNVTTRVPLKRTIRHMAGKRLNKKQAAANRKLSGMSQLFYVNQLISLLDAGLIDKSNEELMEALGTLSNLLEKV